MTIPTNPLLSESTLDYQLPPFDLVRDEHFLPAFEQGIADHTAQVRQVAENPEAPTVDNTLRALERSGRLLDRASKVLFNLISSDTNEVRQQVRSTVAPMLAEHRDAIYLDAALYQRIATVYEQRAQLDAEDAFLARRYHLDFRRAGAGLPETDQRTLREINAELARLATDFDTKVRADTNDLMVLVDDETDLKGMPADAVAAAAELATSSGEHGKYALKLGLPTIQPALASLENAALRERLYRASIGRGNRGNDNDTASTIAKIAQLRATRAELLGYPNHAAYIIDDQTAGSVSAAMGLLTRLVPPAVAKAREESAELAAEFTAGNHETLEAWDWPYFAEHVRKSRFDIDDAALRPYFELRRVLHDGVFYAANKLYGLEFTERPDLPVYHPDVLTFEVRDGDGAPVGLFLADYFTRESKRGGAWMNTFVDQSRLLGTKSVVVNNLNIAKPPRGEPALLTFDEVLTAFHEFGHALHGLLSDVSYPTFSGTSVPRDFVEFPSQVNEMWATWPEVLANYARHYRTGERLPQRLVDRLLAAQRHGTGFATTEYLAAALLDQAWHQRGSDADEVHDVGEFEESALRAAGVALPGIAPRYRSTYFQHIFAGGYSAGYYSYIWSQVLDADAVEWFTEHGGLRRESGERFRSEVLAKGGGVDAMTAYRAFRGRDPELAPLLARKGFPVN